MSFSLPQSFYAAVLLYAVLGIARESPAEEAAWLGGDTVQVATQRMGLNGSHSSEPLLGFLARPNMPGRHPAVVNLHGCGGFGPYQPVIADVLKSYGYVALALDSLGELNACNGSSGDVAESFDSYAALDWLAGQDFVESDHSPCSASRWAATRPSTMSKPGRARSKRPNRGTSGLPSPIIPLAGIGRE